MPLRRVQRREAAQRAGTRVAKSWRSALAMMVPSVMPVSRLPAVFPSQHVEAVPAVAYDPGDMMTPPTYAADAVPGSTVEDWSAGVVVSMSGVSVGGSYRSTDNDDGADEVEQFDVGISYGEGPWTVSLNYGEMSQDSAGLDNGYARLLGNYNIGPGINLAGAIGQDTFADNQDTTFAGVAMAISF